MAKTEKAKGFRKLEAAKRQRMRGRETSLWESDA